MLRYVALLGKDESAVRDITNRLVHASPHWAEPISTNGLALFVTGERAGLPELTPLTRGRGVVIGAFFKRKSESELSRTALSAPMDDELSERIVRTRGQHLIDAYWGSYVAIVRDEVVDETFVVRGPAASLPCLRTTHRGLQVFMSYMPDAIRALHASFSINWSFVTKYLLSRHITVAETGLNEVSEVRCGERVTVRGRQISTSDLWNPVRLAHTYTVTDFADARDLLRLTTKECVHGWASRHSSLLHNLSGGLDSSIVLGCLADSPSQPRVTCINHFADGPESDERKFAHIAARRAGYELIENRSDPTFDIESTLEADVTERPQGYFGRKQLAKLHADLARKTGATAVFNGQRGDEMYYKAQPALAAADYLHKHGPSRRWFDAVWSAAELEELCVWKIFGSALYRGLISKRWGDVSFFTQHHTLTTENLDGALQMSDFHRWPEAVVECGTPVGKQFHIFAMTNPERYYYMQFEEPGEPVPVSPLISQPLVEACARIPTYLLTSNGLDRALAREAFSQDVPPEIINRRTKGGMEQQLSDVLKEHIEFIRRLMLNGALVQHGILDQGKLTEALSGRPSGLLKGRTKLFQYICVETWLRIWERRGARLAA